MTSDTGVILNTVINRDLIIERFPADGGSHILQCITKVTGTIRMEGNESVGSLSFLSFTEATSGIDIFDNPKLTSVDICLN